VVLQMISVGEESGELDDLLREVAEMYQREVEYELKTLSSQIEPILIVLLGVLVLILALGVFLPMWNLGKLLLQAATVSVLRPGFGPRERRRAVPGFTLIELIIVVCIVALCAALLLDRLRFYQEAAEKAAMEYTVATMKSALQLRVAAMLVRGEEGSIGKLARSNPWTG